MDGLPNDVLARVFSHLPTLDLGRMMSVSRSWNTLLSTSPNLWTNVNLLCTRPEIVSTTEALQIVEIFSNRSQSTLATVMLPSLTSLKPLEVAKLVQLLTSSRSTLRNLAFWPEGYNQPKMDLMDFVSECSHLEELDLTGDDRGCEQVETSPGVLTHFSCLVLKVVPENHVGLLRNLRALQVMEFGDALLLKVLSNCSGTLQYFRFDGEVSSKLRDEFQEITSKSLHQLKVLRIEESHQTWSKDWNFSALENLEELGINVGIHSIAGRFKNQIKLHLLLPYFTEEFEGDSRLEWLQSLIDVVDSHQGSLQVLSLSSYSGGDIIKYSIDQFLEFLRANIVLGAPCPNLKELHLPQELDFNATLLAEVLLSRRLLSKGHSILTPGGNQGETHRCSELVLFLDSENQENFKEAEREVLSKCSEWMREAAGKATLRTRSLSD